MKNTLALKTERLAELSTDDLHRVNGAAATLQDIACIAYVKTLHGCTTNIYCP